MATSGGQTLGVTISANMDPSGILGAVKQMQGAFNGLKLPANLTGDILKDFNKLQESLKKFDSIAKQDHFSKADLRSLEKLQKEIDSTFGSLKGSFDDLSGQKFYLDADYTKIKEARAAVDELKADIQSKLSEIKIDFSSAKGGTASLGLDELIAGMERGVKSSKVLSAAMGEVKQSLKAGDFSTAANQLSQIITKSNDLKGAGTGLLNTFKQWGLIDFSTPANELVKTKKGAELLATALSKIVPEISKDNEAVQKLVEKLQEAIKKKEGLEKTGAENLAKEMSAGAQSAEQLGSAFKTVGQSSREMAQGVSQAAEQVKQLQQSTQYFFSLRNMINLLKRGIREAVDVVKELDAAMTETAVVTNFSVSDMWAKLPEYTANANALGATVKDMYKATTLYYQQGLDTNAAMGIANETMKMARIGGLEAADATDKMTAALRGFNMELNEVSAQRVNDVYSNLAAKTASNTEELGTAMQRTASIAASAGMSFEGTAAFLAQAIETTREPAENLGTAMKTIVARFTELKKNPLEISEVDGEEVDYNKVDTALKSIGVSLKDTNGQFRNLDQVFLDISERWDSLTQTQQRYIATTAAGSRQQSRFIAMMSNYERTMQLMDYANNSTGASSEQFGKTMESLEAKINKLKNAWNKFLMGIMNDSWTKGIVDGTTKVLNIVTTLIDKLSFGQKGIKSVLSLFTAFTALKLTGRGANALIGGLGGLIDPNSSFKEGLRGGALGGQAAKISSPIVKAIYDLIPHIDKAAANEAYKYQQYGNFKEAQRDLRAQLFSGEKSLDKYSFSGVYAAVEKNKLNTEQQNALFKSFPGLKKNMTKALSKMLQEYGTDPQIARNLAQGFKKGKIPFDKALEKSGMLLSFGQKMAQIEEKEGQAAAKKFQRDERQRLSREQRQNILNAGKKEGYTGKELQEYYVNETNKALQSNRYAANKKAEELLNGDQTLTTAERAANAFGRLGGALTSAGMSMQMLGSQVSAVNPLLGTLITKAGGLVSAVGAIPNLISSVIAGGPAIWAITAAITALGLVIYDVQKRANNIKNTAAKVTEAFKDTNKETQDNINSLKQYQEQAATWAKGVDSYGNNINLSDEDYNQYLQAVDKIAKINPSIVQGYNAQGHAIVNINKALSETIELEKKRQEDAFKQYLDPASLDKIVRARNIDNNFQTATLTLKYDKGSLGDWFFGEEGNFGFNLGEWIDKTFDSNLFTKKTAAFTDEVTEIIENLQKDLDTSDLTEFFKPFNINWEKLSENDSTEIQKFVKNREAIYSAALKQSGGELSNKLADSFTTLDTNAEGFTESINATLEWLSTYVSNSPAFADLSAEIQAGINQSLENIAIQPDLTATEMQSQADILIKKIERLTSTNSQYNEALRIAQDAQTKFANSLDETQYDVDITPALEKLNTLKQTALQEETAYGDALAQYLENQIQRISKFTTEGGANLTEALNTATDEIAAAEGALDSFNEATKKDFSTAAEGMKGIFDKTTETFKDSYGTEIQKHAEGMGDATFWTGAEALLSGKELERLTKGKNGYDAAEAVAKKIKGLEPMLREGQEGFDAFTDRVLENADAMDKLAEAGVTYDKESGLITNIPDDQWHNVAEALGISDDLLTSMLNKGRQFADISFMNVDEAREALATSEYTIKGTQAAAGEQQNLYVKEDTLRRELSDAGYVRKEQQDEQIAKLLNEGVKTIPADATQLNKDELDSMAKDWGVNTLPDLIQTLNETGDFTKDEIKNYADQMGLLGSDAQYDELYSSIIEAAENPELVKQTGVLETISAQVAALADTRTGKEAKEDYDKAHKELVGGKGIDTQAQAFAKGQKLDENGKLVDLSAGEYEQTKASMQEVANSFRETVAIAAEKVKTASDDEQKKYWKQVQEGAEADAARTDKYIQMADEAMKKRAEAEAQEAEGRKKETDARNKAREEEQARLAAEQQEKRGEQQENYWRERGKQETQAAQVEDIQSKTDYLLQTSINTSLKTALDNLDPTQIASDPAQSQAFSNLYKDLINGTLPKPEDLQTLGIFSQLDSQYQDQITGAIEEKSSFLGEKFNAAYQAFAEADKAALAMDVVPANDNVSKVITTIGQRLKNWWDKINNVNTEVGSANVAPAVNTGAQTVVNIAKDAIQDTQSKITVDTSESEAKITNLKTLVDSTISTIQQGANFKINVKDSGLKKAAKRAESITKASGNKSINVTASGADGANKLSTAVKDFSKLNNKTINLTAKSTGLSGVQSLTNAVQAFHRLTNKTITLKTIKETVNRGGSGNATGAHNHGYFSAPPKAGSAARGSYGQLGPKGKGGLTLTGELGYEIAWIPSENRSMILGANGPQMINLPGDAVVWTHEQSKKILKQKTIPAGSHANESASIYKKKYNNNSSGGNGGNGGNTSQPKSKSKTIDRTLQKQIRQVTAEAGHVVVWWENMARRVESVQRQAEKNQKKLEGLLTKITSTTKTVNGTVKNYQKNLKTSIALNQREVLRAKRELKALNTGSNKYYSQEDVSYEEKVNGKKESKEITINLDRYIKYNKLFKNYDIDWKLLEQIGTWGWYDSSGNKHAANKSLAEAIKAAAEKAINDRVSKRNTAEDNVTKAREELEKLSKDIYDTFYGWETSLTKIWNITQKIEALTTKISRLDAGTSLLEAQIGSGMRISDAGSAQTDIQLFKQRLNLQNRILLERQNAITQATQDVKDAISVKDENTEITTINDMLKNPKKYKLKDTDIIGLKERKKALKEQRTVITRAKKYLTTTKNADGTVNIDFNYEKLNEDRLNGKITADMAKAIEKYKDSIEEANNNLNEQRQALIEGVTEYYNTLKDLREQWADYEDQLIQITEENNKKELDQLKTLSDSVKQSLDDLLNDVKRKLDERRKQEDNANTERDISQKQQRLAMLRADTSGGHQVEIAQLEKEIAEAQQNYQRSLEDQLLEKLQNQADEAAKQRERQIELQEKIATSVNNIALVDMWMANPEQYREEIIQAYKNAQDYDEQGIYRQSVIDTDAEAFFNNVRTNQDKQKETINAINGIEGTLKQIEEDLKWIGATVENARDRKLNVKDVHEKLGASYKSLKEEGGYTIKDFFESKVSAKDARGAGFNLQELKDIGYNAQQLQSAGYTAKDLKDVGFTMQDLKDVYTPSELKSAGFELKDFEAEKFDYSSVRDAGFTVDKLRESEVYGKQAEKDYEKIQKKYNNFLITRGAKTKKEAEKAGSSKFWGKLTSNGYNTMIAWGKQLGLTESQVATDLAKTDKLTWKDVIKAAKGAKRGGKRIKQWYPNAKKTSSFYKAFESVFGAGSWKKYISGGLATQTGPAWLDGTPSKPELVLNAADTKNFLALKDVLAGAMKGMSNTSNTYGDILYEININVDKIEKDYDVDRVVEKVKKEITKGAGYRNVTQVRNFR